MSYKKIIDQNPFAPKEEAGVTGVNLGGTSGWYGACSIEDFLGNINDLRSTHEDVEDFLNYPTQFTPANFWYKDRGVGVWLYEEEYDNWQNRYGMDAVTVFYHAGHGDMDPDGTFWAPTGSIWNGRSWACSRNMAFANEELRYLFWSTCLGLRVNDGHSPIRTWSNPNKGGLRMIFGYDTVITDSRNYGKYFWQEWRKNRTFKNAFIEASWRISHNQTPVVCAMGRDYWEAKSRLVNERIFDWPSVSSCCWAWEWRVRSHKKKRKMMTQEPDNNNALILYPNMINDTLLSTMANKVGITQRTAASIKLDNIGNRIVGTKDIQVSLSGDGQLSFQLGKANYQNEKQIEEKNAVKIAESLISDLGLSKGVKLVQGTTYNSMLGGGSTKNEELLEPKVMETIIQFRQEHSGIESVNSEHGLISVAVDNDGKVTRVFSSLKPVVDERKQVEFGVNRKSASLKQNAKSREEQFQQKIDNIIGQTKISSKISDKLADSLSSDDQAEMKPSVKIIDEKIGYDFSSNFAKPVHQREVEIKVGRFAKRYKLRVDL
ncbi:DUF6345 domain-containing protein [Porphyromonas macacae]|uniref:Uncharacterized protein n=1 Tax=Porphyromonas macacae TaxID=28115 RepID=A0A379DJ04_9PORP|nr:DUF6345 domain-containing protein [Porphyromonas macacae]SUB78326.1 Uncharacterised protein [Porphyromonas macacae]